MRIRKELIILDSDGIVLYSRQQKEEEGDWRYSIDL